MTMPTIDIIALVTSALTSHAAALDALVTLDVARWGEKEREYLRATYQRQSHGLVVNSIVHDPAGGYGDAVPAPLKKAAKALLTAEDREVLRRGG
jgi:hypothetical protein